MSVLQQTLFGNGRVDMAGAMGQEEPNAANLGVLFWFTVPELKIEPQRLREAYQQAGIPESFLPPAINPADAFRRATGRLRREGDPVSVLIREVETDRTCITRQAVVEIRRRDEGRLRYAPSAEFRFDRRAGSATWTYLDASGELPPDAEGPLQEVVSSFPAAWDECRHYLDSEHIRSSVHRLMAAEQVISARPSGAVYFALQTHRAVVGQLDGLFAALRQQAPAAEFYDLPVIDLGKHREMLAAATLAHVKGEVQGLMRELGTVLEQAGQGRRVRQTTAERYLEETRRLGQLIEEYRQATRDRLVEAGSDLDLLREQVVALMGVAEE